MVDRIVIAARLQAVARDIFDDDALVIDDSTTAGDVVNWHSANHIRLMVAVEEAFKIRFSSDEITRPRCVGELVDMINTKLA